MIKKKKEAEVVLTQSTTIIPFPKRIQTAEGWKRSQAKRRNAAKGSDKK